MVSVNRALASVTNRKFSITNPVDVVRNSRFIHSFSRGSFHISCHARRAHNAFSHVCDRFIYETLGRMLFSTSLIISLQTMMFPSAAAIGTKFISTSTTHFSVSVNRHDSIQCEWNFNDFDRLILKRERKKLPCGKLEAIVEAFAFSMTNSPPLIIEFVRWPRSLHVDIPPHLFRLPSECQ